MKGLTGDKLNGLVMRKLMKFVTGLLNPSGSDIFALSMRNASRAFGTIARGLISPDNPSLNKFITIMENVF